MINNIPNYWDTFSRSYNYNYNNPYSPLDSTSLWDKDRNKNKPTDTPESLAVIPDKNNKEMSAEEINSLSKSLSKSDIPVPTPKPTNNKDNNKDKNWYSDAARAAGLLGEALNKESPMVGSRPLSAQNVGANSGSNMGSNLNDRASLDVKRDTYYDKLLKSFKN